MTDSGGQAGAWERVSQMHEDVRACIELMEHSGATGFSIKDLGSLVRPRWSATTFWRGARVSEDNHRSAHGAARALAVRMLRAGICRCGKRITINQHSTETHCQWRQTGPHWVSTCDAPSVIIRESDRGDLDVMDREAIRQIAARRAARADERP